jgi:hypothetical protein
MKNQKCATTATEQVMTPTTAVTAQSAVAAATTQRTYKFKPGEMVYLDNRRATRVRIIAMPEPGSVRYTCLLEFGSVGWYSDNALMTLAEWLTWWERFRDEIIPKEWRECAENARREFVPPPGWDEAVKRATESNSSNDGAMPRRQTERKHEQH